MPIMRPMFFEDETKLSLIDEKASYFYGDSLLVTPVTEQGAREVEIDLPKGVWFNFWTEQRYQGSQKTKLAAPLDQTPVLVRAGAFIPMVDSMQSTKGYNTKKLTLHYYADTSVSSASSVMYNDDGKDPNSISNNAYESLSFTAKNTDKLLSFDFEQKGDFLGKVKTRQLTLVIHNYKNSAKSISVNTETINIVESLAEFNSTSLSAWYDNKNKQLKINMPWSNAVKIVIK